MPNASGTAIALHDSDDTRDGNGYIIVLGGDLDVAEIDSGVEHGGDVGVQW